ncbi:MAG: hypothetical protein AB7M93_21775, partial [Candidatus Obscuribacterales bacterium]
TSAPLVEKVAPAVTSSARTLTGSVDDLTRALGNGTDNVSNAVRKELETITENAGILSKPGATTDEMSRAALKLKQATTSLAEHSGGFVDNAVGQNISRVTEDVSRLVTSASDNIVTRKLSGLTDEIGAARKLPGLTDNVVNGLDDLERSVNTFGTATNPQIALTQIEQSLQKIAADSPELARTLRRSIEGLDDAVKLGGRMTDETMGLSSRVVESTLPRSLDDVPKFLDQSVQQVKVHANQVGQGADDLLKKVGGVDDTSRLMRQELESISRNSRALTEESTSAARATQASREIELSVRRLSEIAGPEFQDDIARLAQNSRALTTASRNTSLATDLLASTVDNTAALTAQTAEHSSSVSQNILRLQEKAAETLPQKTATLVNNNLDDLATATRRIAEGSVDDLTIKQARRALANLEKLGTGFGDDLTRLADDTNKLIVSAQRQTAATAVETATQTLARQGSNLTRQIDDLVTTAERGNLPNGLLDDISTSAGRLGRSTDDMALVRQIDDSLKLMEGKVDPRTINSMRSTLAEVEQSAINLERARRLEQATQRLFEQADTVANTVTRFVESGSPSPVVRESLVKAADDLATHPQSTSVTRFQQLVKVIDDPELTQALKPALKSLDDTIAETNTLSRFSTQGARAQEALTRIAEGTSSDVTRSFINGIKEDLAEFGATTKNSEILKRVYNQVDALPGQVGRDVRAIVDETVDIARLEQTAAATAQAGRQVGAVTGGLVPVSAEEAVALSRIETIASQIGSGSGNAGLIASLERSLASLSPQNQAALEGLIATLKANLTEQSGLVQRVIAQQEMMIGRNMPRVTRLADLANRSGDLAEVGQRLDVARFLQGGETASLQQTRIAHTVADFAANTADPVMMQLRDGALQKLVRQGDPAAYQQLLIDGLTSEGWKMRTLAAGGSTSRLGAGASNFYQAGKYLLTFQDPKLSRSFLLNAGVLGVSMIGTATYLGLKTQDLLDRYAEPGTEADKLRDRMKGGSGEAERQDVPTDGFISRYGAMIDSPDAYRMEQDLQRTGKLRSFSQIGYVAPEAPVSVQRPQLARTVRFTPMSPDARQGDLVKLAIQQFSMRRIRDFNVQGQLLNATEERVRSNKITGFGAASTGSAQLSTSLRSVAVAQGMKLSSSIHDLMGRENSEAQGLDRSKVTSGGGTGQTSIAAYSSPSGLTFAKVDPDQGNNVPGTSPDDEREITEALLSAANTEGGTEAVV